MARRSSPPSRNTRRQYCPIDKCSDGIAGQAGNDEMLATSQHASLTVIHGQAGNDEMLATSQHVLLIVGADLKVESVISTERSEWRNL